MSPNPNISSTKEGQICHLKLVISNLMTNRQLLKMSLPYFRVFWQVLTHVSFFRGNGDPILQEHGLLNLPLAIGYVARDHGPYGP